MIYEQADFYYLKSDTSTSDLKFIIKMSVDF